MDSQLRPTITFMVLVAFNAAMVGFFALWRVADSAAINAYEESGFNSVLEPPNLELTWIAAHAAIVLLVALDVCLLVLWRRWKHQSTDAGVQAMTVSSRARVGAERGRAK